MNTTFVLQARKNDAFLPCRLALSGKSLNLSQDGPSLYWPCLMCQALKQRLLRRRQQQWKRKDSPFHYRGEQTEAHSERTMVFCFVFCPILSEKPISTSQLSERVRPSWQIQQCWPQLMQSDVSTTLRRSCRGPRRSLFIPHGLFGSQRSKRVLHLPSPCAAQVSRPRRLLHASP